MFLNRKHRRLLNRVLIGAWLIYIPVAELGSTGSFKRMFGTFVALVLMAWLGYLERDYRDVRVSKLRT